MMSGETQPASEAPARAETSSEATKPVDARRPSMSISITPAAVEAAKSQIQKRGVDGTALRVGVRGGGCSGFSYVVEFHDGAPHARDVVYDLTAADGTAVRVVVDKKSLIYLNGSVFDWEKTVMQQGFKFRNPQEKSSCGCGHSFTV